MGASRTILGAAVLVLAATLVAGPAIAPCNTTFTCPWQLLTTSFEAGDAGVTASVSVPEGTTNSPLVARPGQAGTVSVAFQAEGGGNLSSFVEVMGNERVKFEAPTNVSGVAKDPFPALLVFNFTIPRTASAGNATIVVYVTNAGGSNHTALGFAVVVDPEVRTVGPFTYGEVGAIGVSGVAGLALAFLMGRRVSFRSPPSEEEDEEPSEAPSEEPPR